jgi:hypothetical protein
MMGSDDPAFDLNWNAQLLRRLQTAKNLQSAPAKDTQRKTTAADCTVHAEYGPDQIVRYDRAGKWWLESSTPLTARRRLSLAGAVQLASQWPPECVYLNRPGGQAFDRAFRAVLDDLGDDL